MSIFPPHTRGVLEALGLFCNLLWGQWYCSCWTLVLPGVTCPSGCGACSSAALQPGRLDWFEGRVGKGSAGKSWWAVCYCSSCHCP